MFNRLFGGGSKTEAPPVTSKNTANVVGAIQKLAEVRFVNRFVAVMHAKIP